MKRKKLIINARPLDNQNAGIYRFTYELINALHEFEALPYDVILLREKKDNTFPKFETIVLPNITFIPGYELILIFLIIPYLSRKLNPDIVFEPAHIGPYFLPTSVTRVTFIHDLTPILFPEFHTFLSSRLQKILLPGILKRANVIICNSMNTLTDLKKVYPNISHKVEKIVLGVSRDLKPSGIKKSNIIDVSKPYFLTVGTIEPRKNISTIIKAFNIYKERTRSDDKLIICGGKGWKNSKLYDHYEASSYKKDIIFTGYVAQNELITLYSQCKAFIYASVYEGFGLPILEAFACNAKCIIAENSSLIEITPNKSFLFRTFDASDLCSKMQIIESYIVENQRHLELSKFNWKNSANQFLKILSKT